MRTFSKGGQRGAAAVEFALVLTPLFLLLLGTIDWGYYFYVREVIANAAREGARAGSIATTANASAASAATSAYLTATSIKNPVVSTACGPAGSVCVQVTVPTASVTGFLSPGVTIPATATATAVMRIEP
jgi:Flp pilus assembly protein TadG